MLSTGDTPTYEAINTMEEYDVDITKHRATNTAKSDIMNMDIILGMTRES